MDNPEFHLQTRLLGSSSNFELHLALRESKLSGFCEQIALPADLVDRGIVNDWVQFKDFADRHLVTHRVFHCLVRAGIGISGVDPRFQPLRERFKEGGFIMRLDLKEPEKLREKVSAYLMHYDRFIQLDVGDRLKTYVDPKLWKHASPPLGQDDGFLHLVVVDYSRPRLGQQGRITMVGTSTDGVGGGGGGGGVMEGGGGMVLSPQILHSPLQEDQEPAYEQSGTESGGGGGGDAAVVAAAASSSGAGPMMQMKGSSASAGGSGRVMPPPPPVDVIRVGPSREELSEELLGRIDKCVMFLINTNFPLSAVQAVAMKEHDPPERPHKIAFILEGELGHQTFMERYNAAPRPVSTTATKATVAPAVAPPRGRRRPPPPPRSGNDGGGGGANPDGNDDDGKERSRRPRRSRSRSSSPISRKRGRGGDGR